MTALPAVTQPICLRKPALRVLCVRARVAREILAQVAQRVPVDVLMPDGSLLGGGAPRADRPTLEIVRPTAVFERLAHHPKIGIGEAYMAGDWRAAPGTDLAELLLPFAERLTTAVPPRLLALRGFVDRRIPAAQRNSLLGSRRNIEAHYDLSNELFATFLDETLTYSSALFDPARAVEEQDLAEAQVRKVNAILDEARVTEGSRVLEIGTGWGTLAIEAARRGADVTSLTLSREQATLARKRVAEAGLTDRVDIRIEDYREVEGSYDAIVSVEMIEAVGEEYWPAYFRTIDERLAPGGVAAVQAILMSHERLMATKHSYGWIQKHIFPGGLIPSLRAIEETTADHTALTVTGVHAFGRDYAETLRRWRETFTSRWPEVHALGFDETFRRKWEFYLAYCEAGFASGYLDVAQVRLERAQDRTAGGEAP
ncbi:cyclopropane-fatty-acyl-phospholipid synthase [Intrasporangium oryzae NRRL B-24470]|uniref:Cyclopropane-fatty-acyl-phospholipid synthase n=1 Tax=Intrasporangium oryzae NRRL B-24470 TaxID=1386089 RepID=W9G8U9_9MICO|nr:cyclopropane-fatty-acyl-phospholipid synthase family protein [Intrasporangium oryzae]EWT02475.1 cyclopropane-fatty-acyl-phospholipid synthase [Intrasporangium oryzae NRRL B-24470]